MYSDLDGSSVCLTCSVGTYSSTGSSSCTSCPAGKYGVNRLECFLCSAGNYSSLPGMTHCNQCVAGSFSTLNSTSCISCASGKYSSFAGFSLCLNCEFGLYAPTSGSTSCSACVPNSAISISSGDLNLARYALSSVSIGNKIVLAGGFDDNLSGVRFSDFYDIQSYVWTFTSNALSEGRGFMGVASYISTAVFVGGKLSELSGIYSDNVDIFDCVQNSWTSYDSGLSFARSNIAATTVGDIAMFCGGFNDTFVFAVCDIYNFTTSIWSTMSAITPRAFASATSIDSIAIFAGGNSSSAVSNTLDMYDSLINTWSTYFLSSARSNPSIVSTGSSVYIFGGSNSDADVFDILTRTISTISTPSVYSSGFSALAWGCKIIVAGGFDANGVGLNVLDLYDLSTATWTNFELISNRGYVSTASVGSILLISGGYNGTSLSSVDYVAFKFCVGGAMNNIGQCNCPVGTFYQSSNSSCVPCGDAGTYSIGGIGNASVNCLPCPVGTYAETSGNSACINCPNGFNYTYPGASSVSLCISNNLKGDSTSSVSCSFVNETYNIFPTFTNISCMITPRKLNVETRAHSATYSPLVYVLPFSIYQTLYNRNLSSGIQTNITIQQLADLGYSLNIHHPMRTPSEFGSFYVPLSENSNSIPFSYRSGSHSSVIAISDGGITFIIILLLFLVSSTLVLAVIINNNPDSVYSGYYFSAGTGKHEYSWL